MISLRDNSSTFQMYIHDKNEYARGHNYLNHVSLDSFESKYIYLKISRMEMASDCEKSQSYSFNKCVENHVIKVLEIFFPKKILVSFICRLWDAKPRGQTLTWIIQLVISVKLQNIWWKIKKWFYQTLNLPTKLVANPTVSSTNMKWPKYSLGQGLLILVQLPFHVKFTVQCRDVGN